MGLLTKIEDKLSGGHHGQDKHGAENKAEHKLEKQAVKQEMGGSGSGSHVPGSSGTSGTHDNRHGMSNDPYSGQSSATDRMAHPSGRTGDDEFRDQDGYGARGMPGGYEGDSTRGPRQPFDPYSSKGQSTAANAMTGGHGQQHDYSGRGSVDDPNVPRSRTGGVRNSVDEHDPSRHAGLHPNRQNYDAIPTAGGQKLGTGSGNDPYESGSRNDQYGSSDPRSDRDRHQHHYGRDAALAGVAGAGAHEMGKDRHHRHDDPYDSRDRRDEPYGSSGSQSDRDRHQHQHHYGRDAALAGGAGVGAHELNKERHHHNDDPYNSQDRRDDPYGSGRDRRGDTGPASGTIGPHSNNMANVMDPRVQPQAEKQRDYNNTAGPHRSDLANKMDPRVDSDRSKERNRDNDQHHYGRDATLAGGAGAAGLGAYEMDKNRYHNRNDPYEQSQPHHGRHGHHDQSQYEAGQTAARQSMMFPPQGGNSSSNDQFSTNRPDPGTQLDGNNNYGGQQQRQHHPIRDAALAGGAGAGAGALAGEGHGHHGHHGQGQHPYGDSQGYGGQQDPTYGSGSGNTSSAPGSAGGLGGQSGIPTEKKLGGAYEAGYRDAMQHLEAEMKKQHM